MIVSSPNKNIVSKIFYDKTRLRPDMTGEREIMGDDRCLFRTSRSMFGFIKYHENVFVVGERYARNVLLSIPLFEGAKIFDAFNNIFEYPLANFFNPDKPEIGQM